MYVVTSATHIGGRPYQQDRAASWICEEEGALCAAVADGMGGHPRGDHAAGLILGTLQRLRRPRGPSLQGAVSRISAELNLEGNIDSQRPGTTLLHALLMPGGRTCVSWAGDSNAYVQRRGRAPERVTQPHSTGRFLTNCVGGGTREPTVDRVELQLGIGDRLILLTDGVDGVVDMPTFHVRDARGLVAKALSLETRDNATAVVIKRVT